MNMNAIRLVFALAVWFGVSRAVFGQEAASHPAEETAAATEITSAPAEPSMPSIIQELPNYKGDWWTRPCLTGDWGGARTELAENGILFDASVTQWLQGNAHGGKSTDGALRYSGTADYKLRLDTARMGLWPGGLITLRGETKFGSSINPTVGSIMSANYQYLLPVPGEPGETTLSEFYVAQALSEKLVFVAGKMDLTIGDDNEFAHNQQTQFSNTAFRINPVLLNAAPYTTMAAGVILMPTKWLTISNFIADNDPDGAATMTGFNTAFHGRNWYSVMQEFTFKVDLFDKPGHQRFGWFWTSRDFRDFTGDPRLSLPISTQSTGLLSGRLRPPRFLRMLRIGNTIIRGDGPDRRPDDWGLYYNFDQYLYTEAEDPKQGFGLFGRFGWSTGESNIVEEFYSVGVGGKGSIPCRDRDTWGLGYYMLNLTDDLPQVAKIDAEQGVELYYNIEITPWFHLTPDLQVIVDPGGGVRDRDVAIVYGIRGQITF